MVTKPSRLRCACAGARTKSCRMPMKIPNAMPMRPTETLMRKSDLIMMVPFEMPEIGVPRIVSDNSVAGEIARHAGSVVAVGIAELLLEIDLLAPDHGKMQEN